MPKFIDSFDLPLPVKRAIEWQGKSHKTDADITCTSLIDSPLIFWLRKRYSEEISVEYADRLWMLYGSMMHLILEAFGEQAPADDIDFNKLIKEHSEAKVSTTVLGWKVEARFDYMLEGDRLVDYKFSSCWSTADGVKPEWERQLNVGLWLMRHDGDPAMREIGKKIKKLAICALFRDWTPRSADKFPSEITLLNVDVWDDAKAEEYITERVRLHQEASKCIDKAPAICSDGERWMSDFAIMSKKNPSRAMKAKIATREEAERIMKEIGGDYVREAAPRRCQRTEIMSFPPRSRCYCEFGNQGFCPWWDAKTQTTRDVPVMPSESVLLDPDHHRKDVDATSNM